MNEQERLLREFWEDGVPANEIVKLLGLRSRHQVYKLRLECGLGSRPRPASYKRKYNDPSPDVIRERAEKIKQENLRRMRDR